MRTAWLCASLAALWLAASAAAALGVELPPERLGLVPGAAALPGALTFFALQAGAVPLAVGLALLALAGAPLETHWGRAPFALFLALALLGGGAATAALAEAPGRPVVGASAGLAAIVAAAGWRFRRQGVPLPLAAGREVRLPAFALPLLWLAGAVAVRASDGDGRATAGLVLPAHLALGLAGLAGAALLEALRLEERGERRRRAARERAEVDAVARLESACDAEGPEAAFPVALAALEADPAPRLAAALVSLGERCGRREEALAAAAAATARAWRDGRREDAAAIWAALAGAEPAPPLALALRLALAPLLAAAGRRREAALTLRGALRDDACALSPGAALRLAEAARTIHPETAIAAARRALASPALDAGKRARIEQWIEMLEVDPARLVAPDLDSADRASERSAAAAAAAPTAGAHDPRALALPETDEPLELDAPRAAACPGDATADPRALRLDPSDAT